MEPLQANFWLAPGNMSILTLRLVKGSELEYDEHDENHRKSSLTIKNVAELRGSSADFDRQLVFVESKVNNGDGFSGNFYWDAFSTDPDDDQDTFQATGVVVGRWKRIFLTESQISDLDKYTQAQVDVIASDLQDKIDVNDVQISLRETAATGIVSGGGATKTSDTNILIAAGTGEIVNAYTDRRNPTVENVSWGSFSLSVQMPNAVGVQVFYSDSNGSISQKPGPLSEQERRTLVQIAFVYYDDGVITSVQQAGIFSNEVGNSVYDFIYFNDFAARTKGLGIKAVNNNLSVYSEAGTFFSPGINIANSLTNPNILSMPQIGNSVSAIVFDVKFSNGVDFLTAQTEIPKFYESGTGVATALTGNDATIGYIFRTFDNRFIYQLGLNNYTTGQAARESLESDRDNHVFYVGSNVAIGLAQTYVSKDATDFTDSAKAGIASIIGSGDNSGGTVADTNSVSNGGQFVSGQTYEKNNLVVSNGYTGITNIATGDSPAPQLTGSQEHTIDQSLGFSTSQNASIVKCVHKYAFNKDVIVDLIQVQVPVFTLNTVVKISILNLTTGFAQSINSPALSPSEWVILKTGQAVIRENDAFEIWLEYYNTNKSDEIIGQWNSSVSTGAPSSQEFTIDNVANPTVIEISHTDVSSNDRAAELDGVVAGSIIEISETGDINRSVKVKVGSIDTSDANSTAYIVSLISNGPSNIRDNKNCSIFIDSAIIVASDYAVAANYWGLNQPTFATVTSELYYDGVLQAGTTDAYGIDFRAQPAFISNDYLIISSP